MANWDDLKNASKYALWEATLGLFNLENPSAAVEEWEQENPKTAMALEMASFIPAWSGYSKAIKGTRLAKAADAAASAEKYALAPFISTAEKEMIQFAPFEAGRQVIGGALQEINSEKFGEVDWGERAFETGLNIAGAGLIGGTFGKIASAGKVAKKPELLKALDSSDPWQYQLRQLHEGMRGLEDAEALGTLQQSAWDLENKILREEARTLVQGDENAWLNQIWKGTAKNPTRKIIVDSMEGFESLGKRDRVLEAAQLPEGWIDQVQYPRYLDATGKQGKAWDNKLIDRLSDVGDGWRLGREPDGLFVVGKKLDDGKWFLAKTDNPGFFAPSQQALKTEIEKKAWIDPDSIIKPTGDKNNILDKAMRFDELINPEATGLKTAEYSAAGVAKKYLGKYGDKIKDNQLVDNLTNAFKDYVEPTVFQGKEAPLARKIYGTMQYIRESSLQKAAEMLYGKVKTGGKNVWKLASGGIERDPNGLAARLRRLAKEQPVKFDKVLQAIYERHPWDEVAGSQTWRRDLGEDGLGILQELNKNDRGIYQEFVDTFKNLGISEDKLYAFRKDHWGLQHYWKGSVRQALIDEKGNTVHIVSGENKKGVEKLAQGIVNEARAEGKDWKLGHWWTKNRDLDLKEEKLLSASDFELGEELARRYIEKNPSLGQASFFMPRAGVEGYNRAKTADELIEALRYSYENKYIYLSNLVGDRITQKDLATLAIDNPRAAARVADKVGILKGEQGILSSLVNKVSDSILAPVLGKDSASKIVRTLNTASVHLDLGFGNLAYVTANMLQPITTVLPHLSMIKNLPEQMQWAYDSVPLIGAKSAGVGNVINPLKIMYQGFKMMSNPAIREGFNEALERAVTEGALSPKFIESYIGENSTLGEGIKAAWIKGDYTGVIKEISTYLPNFSEQASRGYSFSVGYALFDSIAKVTGKLTKDQVYAGARRFMENTMFQFAASDRAKILQGPVGGAWGLFKNWTMHYVGWQMEYMNAALKQNCWAPWLWSNVATSMLGGLGASELGALSESFAEWIGDEKFSKILADNWGQGMTSNAMLYGIPGALGFSLRNQVNSPLGNPGEELQRFMGFVYWNRLKAFGNTARAGIDWFNTTGNHPAQSESFQRQLARAFAPKMMYRQMQLDGETLMTGNGRKLLDDVGWLEGTLYKINLPSVRISQAQEANALVWNSNEQKSALTSRYGEAVAQALEMNDGRLLEGLVARVLLDGLDVDNVMKSAQKKIQNKLLSPWEQKFYPELDGVLWE